MLLLTTQEAMQVLDVSRDYLRWLRENNLLKMWKVGNTYRTTFEDIDDFIELTRGHDLSGKGDIITFARLHKLI